MIKLVTLLSRRPDLSLEEFIDRYESGHRLIGEKYLRQHACRYVRRFCRPAPGPLFDGAAPPPCDVVMEIWFPDREAYDATMATLMEPAVAAEIAEDEERLFDRSRTTAFVVEEYESLIARYDHA